LLAPSTAVLGEVAEHPIHGIEIGAIDELPALAPLTDEPRSLKVLKMKG